ncbi:MAG: hypothetical protein IPH83_19060 [Gammaproteobacteria bacterium]|nr:hypothetical protein [Gammaproteobacteria bacterium]
MDELISIGFAAPSPPSRPLRPGFSPRPRRAAGALLLGKNGELDPAI